MDSKDQFVNFRGEGGSKVIILDLNVKKIQNVYTIMIFFKNLGGATAPLVHEQLRPWMKLLQKSYVKQI